MNTESLAHPFTVVYRYVNSQPQVKTPAKRVLSIIAGIGLGFALFSYAALSQKTFAPENAGFGINTFGVDDTFDGQLLNEGAFSKVKGSWDFFHAQKHEIILWLAASQTFTINNPTPGEHLAVWHLNSFFKREKISASALLLARPNANLHDLLALYLTARAQGHLPKLLVVGVVFDDLRDPPGQKAVIDELPEISANIMTPEYRGIQQLVQVKAAKQKENEIHETKSIQNIEFTKSPQEKLETWLIARIEKIFPGYLYRGKLAAKIEFSLAGMGSQFRQKTLHRRAPRIPQDSIDWSYAALDSLIRLTKKDGVPLLLYKPPHRPNEPVFYHDRGDYDAFFKALKIRCENEGIHYADYETIVPEKYWGKADGGLPDVFHFQEPGHKIFSRALFETIKNERLLSAF